MFSVSASPFNSKSRQLYGGWTPQEARAANRPYEEKVAYEIISKYAPDGSAEKMNAKRWLKMYKMLARVTPEWRRGMRERSRAYALGKIPMQDAQKAYVLREFLNGTPISDIPDKSTRVAIKALRQGGLPNISYVNSASPLTVPYMRERPDIAPFPWSRLPDPRPLRGGRHPRIPAISPTDLAREFQIDPNDAVRAWNSWRAHRRALSAGRRARRAANVNANINPPQLVVPPQAIQPDMEGPFADDEIEEAMEDNQN